MHAKEIVQMNFRPPAEMEVIREMDFPKRHKVGELDGPAPSSFKGGSVT